MAGKSHFLMKAVFFKQGEEHDDQSLKILPPFLQHGQVKGIHRTMLLSFNSIFFLFPISLFFWKKQDKLVCEKDFVSQKVLSQPIHRRIFCWNIENLRHI